MIILDTHVLVWWVADPRRLSAKARKAIETAKKEGSVAISAISVWEVGMLVARNRLQLTMDVRVWIEKIRELPFVRFLPVDTEVALDSVFLPGNLHADPADRIIVATARQLGASLVTSDSKIRRYAHVVSVW